MRLRPYQPADADALEGVFHDAVRGTGALAYDAQQVEVWASYPNDREEFRQRLSQGITLVAVVPNESGQEVPVAFGQLDPIDHVMFLYTASQHGQRGYATQLYQQLEASALQHGVLRLSTDASRISKFFFLKMGFHILTTEWVTRKGVPLERFKMAKDLVTNSDIEQE